MIKPLTFSAVWSDNLAPIPKDPRGTRLTSYEGGKRKEAYVEGHAARLHDWALGQLLASGAVGPDQGLTPAAKRMLGINAALIDGANNTVSPLKTLKSWWRKRQSKKA